MRGDKDDASIYFADSTKQPVPVYMAGVNCLTDETLPAARDWLTEVAAMFQIVGSCKRMGKRDVNSLVRGFVEDRAKGLRDLQERLHPAGMMLALQAKQQSLPPLCRRASVKALTDQLPMESASISGCQVQWPSAGKAHLQAPQLAVIGLEAGGGKVAASGTTVRTRSAAGAQLADGHEEEACSRPDLAEQGACLLPLMHSCIQPW